MDNRTFYTRWAIGLTATLVWFFGDRIGIPASAINLSEWIVPGLLAHALGTSNSKPIENNTEAQPIIIPAAGPVNAPMLPSEPTA